VLVTTFDAALCGVLYLLIDVRRVWCVVVMVISNPQHTSRNCGVIIVQSEEVRDMRMAIHLKLEARSIDKKDFFGKSDGFLRISRVRHDNSYVLIHKTEVIKNSLNPTWQPFKLPLHTLCNGNLDQQILIECYDWNRSGHDDFIGSFRVCTTKTYIHTRARTLSLSLSLTHWLIETLVLAVFSVILDLSARTSTT
jgi:hypothetical protein